MWNLSINNLLRNFIYRKPSLPKTKVGIRSPSPKVRKAILVNEETISVTFDVNIKGPKECQTHFSHSHIGLNEENESLEKCCRQLFNMNEGVMAYTVRDNVNITSRDGGKKYAFKYSFTFLANKCS